MYKSHPRLEWCASIWLQEYPVRPFLGHAVSSRQSLAARRSRAVDRPRERHKSGWSLFVSNHPRTGYHHMTVRVDRKLNSIDVLDALTDLFILRAPPEYIGSDNVPEFIAQKVRDWVGAVGA